MSCHTGATQWYSYSVRGTVPSSPRLVPSSDGATPVPWRRPIQPAAAPPNPAPPHAPSPLRIRPPVPHRGRPRIGAGLCSPRPWRHARASTVRYIQYADGGPAGTSARRGGDSRGGAPARPFDPSVCSAGAHRVGPSPGAGVAHRTRRVVRWHTRGRTALGAGAPPRPRPPSSLGAPLALTPWPGGAVTPPILRSGRWRALAAGARRGIEFRGRHGRAVGGRARRGSWRAPCGARSNDAEEMWP